MERIGIRRFVGAAKIRVQYLSAVRNWKSWLLTLISNKLRQNHVIHSYSFEFSCRIFASSELQASPSSCAFHSVRLSRAPVTYAGGLRDDESGHHCFVLMRRSGQVFAKWKTVPLALERNMPWQLHGGHIFHQTRSERHSVLVITDCCWLFLWL